jgi:hypothetical protein
MTDDLIMRNSGNALLLPHLQQFAVFNLQNGLDVYGFPNFTPKHTARFGIDPCTSQGVAVFKSGTLLASPTKEGNINIFNSHNVALVTTLRCSGMCGIFLFQSEFFTRFILW